MKVMNRSIAQRANGTAPWLACLLLLISATTSLAAPPAALDTPEPLARLLAGEAPESVADLKELEARMQELARRVIPSTVGVRLGAAQGSGVIISADGYVLTAAHVAGEKPGKAVTFILQDGRTVKGKTLGVNIGIDAGLMKIDDQYKKVPQPKEKPKPDSKEKEPADEKKSDSDKKEEPAQEDEQQADAEKKDDKKEKPAEPKGEKILWEFVEMGKSATLKPGQWVVSTGHPGGYEKGRPPVLRVGRILKATKGAITTDCTLVGGDSGGPLFDGYGQVIGIHSRIGETLATNIHVPVDTYRDTWDRLADGEVFGQRNFRGPYIGVTGDPEADSATITSVLPESPAAKAGLKTGDVILTLDGKALKNFEALSTAVRSKKPGTKIKLEVRRGKETINVSLTIGRLGKPPEKPSEK